MLLNALLPHPALLLVLAAAPTSPPQAEDSLEDLLREVRARQEALLEELRPRVAALVSRLDESPGEEDLAAIRRELDALGSEAAPLLLPHLDPGPNADEGPRLRAQEIAGALVRSPSPAITDALVELARTGSEDGRLHAVRVLGHSDDTARAGTELRGLFGTSTGRLRLAIVRALARLAGPKDVQLLRSTLGDPDAEVIATVLAALATARDGAAAPAVFELLEQPARAGDAAAEIVAYYRAVPDAATEEVIARLAELSARPSLEVDARILLLEAIPGFDAARGSRLRRTLSRVQEAQNTDLREAAHVCLALLGDRGAKRELLRTYDEIVDANDDWPDAYERRADAYMRIHEFSDAARDYQRALDLLSSRASQSTYRRIWVDLARAYVKADKLRQAHETLDELGLTSSLVDEIRADPDFLPLIEHGRYGKYY